MESRAERNKTFSALFFLGLGESAMLSAAYKHLTTFFIGSIFGPVFWGLLLFCTGIFAFRRPKSGAFRASFAGALSGLYLALFATQQIRSLMRTGERPLQLNLAGLGGFFLVLIIILAIFGWLTGSLMFTSASLLQSSTRPNRAYATLIAGFALGSPLVYVMDQLFGHIFVVTVGSLGCVILLSLIYDKRRYVLCTALGFIFAFALGRVVLPDKSDKLPVLSPGAKYRYIKGEWSPYHRIDFVEMNGSRLIGYYDGMWMWYTCLERDEVGSRMLGENKRILAIGTGGGCRISTYLLGEGNVVEAVELDPVAMREMKGALAKYNNYVYRHPRVKALAVEGRAYMERAPKNTYDFVVLEGADTYRAFIQRSLAPLPNYLFTRQAWEIMLNITKPDGIILADVVEKDINNLSPIIAAIPSSAFVKLYHLKYIEKAEKDMPIPPLILIVVSKAAPVDYPSFAFEPIEYPSSWRTDVRSSLSDDRPFWGKGSTNIWPVAVFFSIILALVGFVVGRIRKAKFGGIALWLFNGALGMAVETLILSRAAGAFPDPAAGGVWLISLFLVGTLLANIFIEKADKALPLLLVIIIGVAGLLMLTFFISSLMSAIEVSVISPFAGFASGILWAYGLKKMVWTKRQTYFIIDILGGPIGVFLSYSLVMCAGFCMVAKVASILIFSLWLLVLVFPKILLRI